MGLTPALADVVAVNVRFSPVRAGAEVAFVVVASLTFLLLAARDRGAGREAWLGPESTSFLTVSTSFLTSAVAKLVLVVRRPAMGRPVAVVVLVEGLVDGAAALPLIVFFSATLVTCLLVSSPKAARPLTGSSLPLVDAALLEGLDAGSIDLLIARLPVTVDAADPALLKAGFVEALVDAGGLPATPTRDRVPRAAGAFSSVTVGLVGILVRRVYWGGMTGKKCTRVESQTTRLAQSRDPASRAPSSGVSINLTHSSGGHGVMRSDDDGDKVRLVRGWQGEERDRERCHVSKDRWALPN